MSGSTSAGKWDASQILKGLNLAGKDFEEKANRGVWKAAEYLRGRSQEIVPHDEGDLEASADVSQDRDKITAVVAYDTPYAVRQHEDMTLQHLNGRKAKYLEGPMNDAAVQSRMRDLIQGEFK